MFESLRPDHFIGTGIVTSVITTRSVRDLELKVGSCELATALALDNFAFYLSFTQLFRSTGQPPLRFSSLVCWSLGITRTGIADFLELGK